MAHVWHTKRSSGAHLNGSFYHSKVRIAGGAATRATAAATDVVVNRVALPSAIVVIPNRCAATIDGIACVVAGASTSDHSPGHSTTAVTFFGLRTAGADFHFGSSLGCVSHEGIGRWFTIILFSEMMSSACMGTWKHTATPIHAVNHLHDASIHIQAAQEMHTNA